MLMVLQSGALILGKKHWLKTEVWPLPIFSDTVINLHFVSKRILLPLLLPVTNTL
jgi:hypothetical protein